MGPLSYVFEDTEYAYEDDLNTTMKAIFKWVLAQPRRVYILSPYSICYNYTMTKKHKK